MTIRMNEPIYFDIHPGETLLDAIEDQDLTQAELARAIHVHPKVINEICRGKRGISPEMAFKLAAAFGTTPDYWMEMQKNYEMSQVDCSKMPRIRKLVA